jgi:exosortase
LPFPQKFAELISKNQVFTIGSIKIVILAGQRDFGRCPIATRLPMALWPIAGKSVLEHLLDHLANQGVNDIVICSNGDSQLLKESVHINNKVNVTFLYEQLPAGTAGCIRDAASNKADSLLFVIPANIINPPKIDYLINAHKKSQADLTVVFNPANRNGQSLGEPAEIYICQASVLAHIPKEGYFDIKEELIPELLLADKTIHAEVLPNHAGNFRDRPGYLYALANYLENNPGLNTNLKTYSQSDAQNVWIAASATVDQGARIYGPTIVLDGAHISDGTIIFGPTTIGRDVHINKNTIVTNSAIWDFARIGPNCRINKSVVGYHANIPGNTMLEEKSIQFKPNGAIRSLLNSVSEVIENGAGKLHKKQKAKLAKINKKLPNWTSSYKTRIAHWIAACLVVVTFLWSYWPSLKELWNVWQRNDEYSCGLLVPFLAIYILWSRRHDIAECTIKPSFWGIFVFIAAQAIRLFGLFFMYGSAERLSIALSAAAVVLLLFGWKLLRKVSTILLFLCLMLPWPNRIQAAVALPLQRWATTSAVFCLEILGYQIIREGNVIHIGNTTVAVAEACNGLRMVTAFFVISGLVVLLVNKSWWEKLIVLASSLPIALLCNTVRLTATAIAFTMLTGEYWEKIFHDYGGYAMMPLALAVVMLELWLLTKLTTPPVRTDAIIIERQDKRRTAYNAIEHTG